MESTAWAEIESGPPRTTSSTSAPAQVTHATRTERVVRLKRTPNLVVGSIDAAAHVFQRRARHILLGSAVFMVPMLAFYVLLTGLALEQYEQFDTLLGDRGYVGVETGFAVIALIIQSFTAHIIGAFTAAYLVPFQMGDEPRVGMCVRRVVRKLPLLGLVWTLTHWPTLLILWWFASIAPVEVLGLAFVMVPLIATISAAAVVLAPVVMSERFEGRSGLRSISRAWTLVRHRFAACFAFVFACGVIGGMLALFVSFLPDLAQQTGLITFGSLGWLVQGIASQMAILIVMPFVAIATAQLYLQLRVHTEGLDIIIAAERAFP